MPIFADIPKFPRAYYEITVEWNHLERQLESFDERGKNNEFGGMDMNPDYQRGHVWTRAQQIAYVEYQLMGGEVGRNIVWNSPDWDNGYKRPTELVDGKQRITAVLAFMRNEVPAFGHLRREYTDSIRLTSTHFQFRICKLESREEILQLYLNINAGGTPHTAAEIARVRALLAEARGETTSPVKAKKAAKEPKKDSWLAAVADGSFQEALAERSRKARR
jgi:hypothetical protein